MKTSMMTATLLAMAASNHALPLPTSPAQAGLSALAQEELYKPQGDIIRRDSLLWGADMIGRVLSSIDVLDKAKGQWAKVRDEAGGYWDKARDKARDLWDKLRGWASLN
ncbi:hypothetical protein XA68_12055 [Ophiocordyceps unilateralis]|uniref:Uncharacterized protein n=1 Tax=Ophiocordyceps unilateralis TaxID=268505 RepID=A0A0L9T0M5_OPHUN|nr:hypothetical protein XA68_18478 [Ophiocordyceps unilateralis]PFH59650.1 hypothetical protein XA68_12055 [Ophiocordyceps unilateralis]